MLRQHEKNIVFLMLLTVVMSGCAGSKLRNLVTRSDYQSLEELEAADARDAALLEKKVRDQEAKEALVSSGKAVDADDAESTSEEPKRGGIFNLASFFTRKPSMSEIEPDPFVDVKTEVAQAAQESEKAVEAKVAKASEKVTAKAAEAVGKTDQAATEKAEKFTTTISSVEEQAKSLFEELAAASAEDETSATAGAADFAEMEIKPAQPPEPDTMSFADFAAHVDAQKNDVKQKADEIKVKASAQVAAPKEKAAAVVSNTVSEFDRLLGGFSDESPQQSVTDAKGALDDSFFEDIASTPKTAPSATVAPRMTESVVAGTKDTGPFFAEDAKSSTHAVVSPDSDPFAMAAQKHGFRGVRQEDPWAAFARQGVQQEDRNQVSSVSPSAAEPSAANQFQWGRQPALASPSSVQFPSLAESRPKAEYPAFAQVSATTPSANQPLLKAAPVETEPALGTSGGLMIPDLSGSSTNGTLSSTFEETYSEPAPLPGDPFLSAAPIMADIEDSLDGGLTEDSAAGGSAVTAVSGWTMRTWILVIGSVVVALLLLMPERQNRANA